MNSQKLPCGQHRLFLTALVAAGLMLGIGVTAGAVTVSHTPTSGPNPAPFSPAFNPVNPADTAANRYIDFGVSYAGAVAVATFNDPPPAFAGVNPSGILDLETPVNGRIVTLGTTNQGLTNSVSVEAGHAGISGMRLDVFDVNNVLLQSQLNAVDGFSTFGIARAAFDIASFRVSTPTDDSFGVNRVTIETPIGIPEPTTGVLMVCASAAGLFCRRTRCGRR